MAARLEYGKLAPEGLARMRALEHYLNTGTGLEPVLLDLVRLLASRMNGCEYCIQLHTAALRKLHEPDTRIAEVVERVGRVYAARAGGFRVDRGADQYPGGPCAG